MASSALRFGGKDPGPRRYGGQATFSRRDGARYREMRVCAQKEEPVQEGSALRTPDSKVWMKATPYTNAFVRSGALSLLCGGAVEVSHSVHTLKALILRMPLPELLMALHEPSQKPQFMKIFMPQFAADHVASLVSWSLLWLLQLTLMLFRDAGSMGGGGGGGGTAAAAAAVDQEQVILEEEEKKPGKMSTAAAAVSTVVNSPSAAPKMEFRDGKEEMTAEEKRDLVVRRRPGALADDSFFKTHVLKKQNERAVALTNFWYAAALSSKLTNTDKNKPLKIEMLNMTLVLWRNEEDGSINCLEDVCPHRGAPLSGGWCSTKNGKSCVVCPYHGWSIDGNGSLQEIPSNNVGETFPRRPFVKSFDVVEKGGYVWLFYEDFNNRMPELERPPIPWCPELDSPDWHASYGEFEFNAGHNEVFENAIDPAHVHYLHDFGNQNTPKICDMGVEYSPYQITASFILQNKPPGPLWEWTRTSNSEVHVTSQALLASTSIITFELAMGVKFITFVNTVPISSTRTINRFCLIRNFALTKQFDGFAVREMCKIFQEDKDMIEQLRPELVEREVSVRADLPQIAYRRLKKQYIDMGYGKKLYPSTLPTNLDM